MQVYTLEVRSRSITLASDDSTLVRTSSGVDTLELLFYSDEWLDFDLSCALAVDGVVYEDDLVLDVYHEEEEPMAEEPTEEEPADEPTGDADDPDYDPEPDIEPEYDDEPEPEQWLARAYVVVPDEILEHSGALGVTVHGQDESGNYIVTALSEPLQIMNEGDDGGNAPQPSPYRG